MSKGAAIIVDADNIPRTFMMDTCEVKVYVNEKEQRRNIEISVDDKKQGIVIIAQFMNPRSLHFFYGDEV